MNSRYCKLLSWAVLAILASVEFIILYHGDLPPGPGFSVIPLKQAIALYDSLFVDGAVESNYNLLLLPFMYIGPVVREIVYLLLIFIAAFLSVSYSLQYFFTKYSLLKLSKAEIFLVQVCTSIPFTLSFYFAGGQFFGYSFFIALLPFGLTIFDRILPNGEQNTWKTKITSSIVLGSMASILVVDTRTLLYTSLIIMAFALYAFVIVHSFRNFIRILEITLLSAVFYILINIRFFMAILLLRNDGVIAIGDIVPVQLFISYMRYNFYYAITGSANWSGVYNSRYVALGLIAFLVALVPLLMKKIKAIILFFALTIFILVAYVTTIAPDMNYYIGQTKFYPYLVYSDIDYVFNILYDPFLYLMFGLGLLTIMLYAKKIRKKGTVIGAILVVIILATQVAYLYPEATEIHSGNKTIPVPGYIKDATDYLYSSNLSGNVLVIANFSIESNQYLSLPNAITSDTGWNGWLLSYPDYLMSIGFPAFARAMTYFGVQYIVYNSLNYGVYLHYLSNQTGLREVLDSGPIHVYCNTYYEPLIESDSGFYIVYNVPTAIEYLSLLNVTVPIVPFYTISNFSSIDKYSSGIILPGNYSRVLPSLFSGYNDSYSIDLGSMTINQAPYGWQIAPVIFLGDQLNAVYESNTQSPVPLSFAANIPNGSYYVFVEGGVSVSSQYGSAVEGFNISSGSESVKAIFNQTTFAPMISEAYAGVLNVTTKSLRISPTSETGPYEPFLSKITLIPTAKMSSIKTTISTYLSSHSMIDYAENLSLLNASFYSNAGKTSFSQNQTSEFNVSVIVDFTHENMGLWSYVQAVKVRGQIFSSSYYYGVYNLYVSSEVRPSISYFDSSGTSLIYFNVVVDSIILILFIYLKKKGDHR